MIIDPNIVRPEFREWLLGNLPQISEHFGSPFHIYDELGIRGTMRTMQNAFFHKGLAFKEFYAVKALPKPAIMEIVKSEGCGFDCSSIPELRLARTAGARPEDIMFTSNNTSQEEFVEALAHGGCILNLDGIEFIEKVPGPFPELICFRLNPGSRKTGDAVNTIIGEPLDAKYGVPIEKIVDAYRLAKQKGAKRFGLHTMVCSNDRDYTHMVATYKLLLEVADLLERELDIKLEFVNVGGGIGIVYRPGDTPFDFSALAGECDVLGTTFADARGYLPKMCMESGRYVTGPHGILVNRVVNVYEKYKRIIGVQVAMPALMRVGMYKTAYHHCEIVDANGVPRGGELFLQDIAGPICENCDVLAKQMLLPRAYEGDYVLTYSTGAHGSAMAFNYNGRPRVQELLRCSYRDVRRICRAETYEDLERRHQGLEGSEHKFVVP